MTTRRLLTLPALIVLLLAPALAAEEPREGIQIHGSWRIEIFEPDGTLVGTREFENALARPEWIASLLTRASTVGSWSIALADSSNTMQPCSASGTDAGCIISEPSSPYTGSNIFMNLGLTSSTSVVLSGSATAANSSTIDWVMTSFGTCAPATAPASCNASHDPSGPWPAFTLKNLTSGVSVSPGQIIQVTVTLSFT